jgi:hypothetical protein
MVQFVLRTSQQLDVIPNYETYRQQNPSHDWFVIYHKFDIRLNCLPRHVLSPVAKWHPKSDYKSE